jgi:hypothetical protein
MPLETAMAELMYRSARKAAKLDSHSQPVEMLKRGRYSPPQADLVSIFSGAER